MWRSSLVLTLPIVAFGLPADAEPVLVAKLELPKAQSAAPAEVSPPRAVPLETRVRMYVAGVLDSDAGPVVLLRDEAERVVMPIWIGAAEARAIRIALEGGRFPRPLTHDLLAKTITQLGATVVDVEVSALVNSTFIGTAHLSTAHGKKLALDARPSDLLALALRAAAPIYVDLDVLDAAKLELPHRMAAGVKL